MQKADDAVNIYTTTTFWAGCLVVLAVLGVCCSIGGVEADRKPVKKSKTTKKKEKESTKQAEEQTSTKKVQ